MHDGCNARAWVHVRGAKPATSAGEDAALLAKSRAFRRGSRRAAATYDAALAPRAGRRSRRCTTASSRSSAQRVRISTPGAIRRTAACRAARPRDAARSSAAERRRSRALPRAAGPRTGNEADADPEHRHAVRLTGVAWIDDPVGQKATPAVPIAVTRDPLECGRCAAVPALRLDDDRSEYGSRFIRNVSIATATSCSRITASASSRRSTRFRAVRCSVPRTAAATCARARNRWRSCRVPPAAERRSADAGRARCGPDRRRAGACRVSSTAPASDAMRWSMQEILPEIHPPRPSAPNWEVRRSLLESDRHATRSSWSRSRRRHRHAAVRRRRIRPAAAGRDAFTAPYRVGNGSAGNVGIGALAAHRQRQQRRRLRVQLHAGARRSRSRDARARAAVTRRRRSASRSARSPKPTTRR